MRADREGRLEFKVRAEGAGEWTVDELMSDLKELISDGKHPYDKIAIEIG